MTRYAALLGLVATAAGFQFPSDCDHATRVVKTDATGTITQSSYGADVKLCWFVQCRGGDLSLQFSSFDLEPTYDYLTLAKVENYAVGAQVFRSAALTTPTTSNVNGGDGAYMLLDSDAAVSGTGFTVSWTCSGAVASEFPPLCSSEEVKDTTSGTIAYGPYVSLQSPCWYIPCSNDLTLTWSQLDTELDYDFVTVSTVSNFARTEVLKTSGTAVPASATYSSADGAIIEFKSDEYVNENGFTVQWSCGVSTPATPSPPTQAPTFTFPSSCSASTILDTPGSLDYPTGTASYANNENTCWFFSCPSKQYTVLQWSAFNTESGYDMVNVFPVNGGVIGSTALLSDKSGTSSPSDTVADGQEGIYMRFTSDGSVTRGGFELTWSCADLLPVDYRTDLNNRVEFESLAARNNVPGALEVLEVKFVILNINTATPSLYFMNTQKFEFHFYFVRDSLGAYSSNTQWNDDSYFWDTRKNIAGTMIAHDSYTSESGTQGLYTVEFWPTDPVSAALTIKAFQLIESHFAEAAGRLVHYPAGPTQITIYNDNKLTFETNNVPVIMSEELFGSVTFSPLNLGEGYGTLRVIETGSETFSVRDVVIFKAIPNDLSHVGGIITDEPQTPLSHINLKAKQNNMPNAYIKGASGKAEILALVGKVVQYVVRADGYELREATQAEADAWLESVRPATSQTPLSDLTVTDPIRLTAIANADWIRYGAKAANVAELAKVLERSQVPDGYAIPFSVYDEYMKVKRCEGADVDDMGNSVPNGEFRDLCADANDPAGKSFNEQIQAIMTDADFLSDAETRDDMLKDFRKEVKKGEVPAAIDTKLNAMHQWWAEADGTMLRSVRLRSSTNNEDLAGFNGAGLYESTTHDPDEGDISKSAKKVWAGLWTFRAYEERDFYRIDHFKTYMGVLAHESYGDEQVNGVGVTKNVYQQGTNGHYINAQYGEISVTNPEPIVVGGETVNSIPDEFLLAEVLGNDANGNIEYQWIQQYMRHSNVETVYGVPVSTVNVLTDAEVVELRVAMAKVQVHFKPIYNGDDTFAIDIEFKITRTTDGSRGHLEIKQARPWID